MWLSIGGEKFASGQFDIKYASQNMSILWCHHFSGSSMGSITPQKLRLFLGILSTKCCLKVYSTRVKSLLVMLNFTGFAKPVSLFYFIFNFFEMSFYWFVNFLSVSWTSRWLLVFYFKKLIRKKSLSCIGSIMILETARFSCLNERNVNLISIWAVISSCKDFAAKRHLVPALMHFGNLGLNRSYDGAMWFFIYGVIKE